MADIGGHNGPPTDKGAITRLDAIYIVSPFNHVVILMQFQSASLSHTFQCIVSQPWERFRFLFDKFPRHPTNFASRQHRASTPGTSFTMAPRTSPFNLATCARPNILKLQPYRCAREYVYISDAVPISR